MKQDVLELVIFSSWMMDTYISILQFYLPESVILISVCHSLPESPRIPETMIEIFFLENI